MKNAKHLILPIVLAVILIVVVVKLDAISNYIGVLFSGKHDLVVLPKNEYTKEHEVPNANAKPGSYLYITPTDDYEPYSYKDLLNIFYTLLNNGWDTFTFYCPTEYENCIPDIEAISKDESLLNNVNNFVHPFNSYEHFNIFYNPDNGEVTVKIEHLYTDYMIKQINKKVDDIIDEVITDEMDLNTKVLTIHDYIINNAKYDVIKNEGGESEYSSNTAYGALLEGYAICGGYADAMALFLTKFGLNNYKIASDTHVWNAVYMPTEEGKYEWKHLDLTWDDPVADDGNDYLYHKYFLVNDQQLKDADGNLEHNHDYDKNIYLEFKKEN